MTWPYMYRASLQQISRLLDCLGEFLIFFLSYKLKRGRADQRLSHRRQTWDVQLEEGPGWSEAEPSETDVKCPAEEGPGWSEAEPSETDVGCPAWRGAGLIRGWAIGDRRGMSSLKRGRADQRLSHRRQTWDVQLKRGQADQRQAHQSLTRHLYWNKD